MSAVASAAAVALACPEQKWTVAIVSAVHAAVTAAAVVAIEAVDSYYCCLQLFLLLLLSYTVNQLYLLPFLQL